MAVIDLTTSARVKRRRGITGTGLDDLLSDLITEVSADVAAYLGRHIWDTSRTETYEIDGGQHIVSVRGAPISTLTSVIYNDTDDFSGVDALTLYTGYSFNAAQGLIRLHSQTPYYPGYLQVEYDGGMVTGTDESAVTTNFITSYPEIAGAVDMQVLELLRRKDGMAGGSSFGRSSVSIEGETGLLKDVRRRLDFYARRSW